MANENLSEEDQDFLTKVEEELKDRYTEKDEEFMKVFRLPPSVPPIMENWYHSGTRNYNSRRFSPYERNNRDRGFQGRDSGYHRNRNSHHGHGSYGDHRRGYNDYEDDRRDNNRQSQY